MTEPSSRKQRTDGEYEIDALAKGLKVLEALQDATTLAVQTQRVKLRTGYSYDFCFRALKTLKLAGFVAEVDGGWKLTPRTARIGGKLVQAATPSIPNNRNPLAQPSLEIKDL
jgi:hypothetical protein